MGERQPRGPRVAWIARGDGSRLDLMLDYIGDGQWVARPAEGEVRLTEDDEVRIDVLLSGQSVRFEGVLAPGA